MLAAALLLLGSSLAPAVASNSAVKLTSKLAFDNPPSRQKGKADAVAWYNATNPTPAQVQDEYDMALQNRLAAEAGSDEYYYWTGYQFQVKEYM